MNKIFEMILERLEDTKNFEHLYGEKSFSANERNIFDQAKGIVQDVAEEYGDGWTPCSEWLPSGLDFVLFTDKDGEVDICSIEYFYDYLDRFTAWQPLPEPYQPK